MKFEENWPRDYREVVQRCGRTDDDGRQVITIAHPEPCSGVLKKGPMVRYSSPEQTDLRSYY